VSLSVSPPMFVQATRRALIRVSQMKTVWKLI